MCADILPLKGKRKKKFERVSSHPNLRRHTTTGMYYVRKQFKRERIPELFKTTQETKLGRAKVQADQMIQQWRNHHLGIDDRGAFASGIVSVQGKPIGEICDEILERLTPQRRVQTRKQHKLYLSSIKEHAGHIGINAYTVGMFDAWIMKLRTTVSPRTGRARQTFDNYAKHMNLVWTFAYQHKYTQTRLRFAKPDRRIRQELEEKPRKDLTATEKEILQLKKARCLTTAEIHAIYPELNDTWRLRFVLSLECFMRFMEAGALEKDRLDTDTGLVTLRAQDVKTGSKTGKGRRFYLSTNALALLRARLAGEWAHGKGEKHHPDSPYVFPNFRDSLRGATHNQRIWKDALKRAGIKGRVRWHDLRHTALTFALLGDSSLPEAERKKMVQDPLLVSEFAGVSMQVIQQVYLHTEAEHTRGVTKAFDHLKLVEKSHTKVTPGDQKSKDLGKKRQ